MAQVYIYLHTHIRTRLPTRIKMHTCINVRFGRFPCVRSVAYAHMMYIHAGIHTYRHYKAHKDSRQTCIYIFITYIYVFITYIHTGIGRPAEIRRSPSRCSRGVNACMHACMYVCILYMCMRIYEALRDA